MALHISKTIKRILAGIGEKKQQQADKQNKQEMLEQ